MSKNTTQCATDRTVQLTVENVSLVGDLRVPVAARGLVLFAHGSGSSRFSTRNRYVAALLNEGGLATLLLDLLTAREEEIDQVTRQLRFDIALLAHRVVSATDWLRQQPQLSQLPIGYFGASTGAAAALMAAAHRPAAIGAVVSRGGRPDLAANQLTQVQAPTLLIVGSDDTPVIEMNRWRSTNCTVKRVDHCARRLHLLKNQGRLMSWHNWPVTGFSVI
ncbi:MAG: dienelactone hydrolase family protein [Caldilineaceae bacterium]